MRYAQVRHRYARDVGTCARFQLREPLAESMLIARDTVLYGAIAVDKEPEGTHYRAC